MANNKSILINYGSEAVVGTTGGLVPGKTATLNTSGHLLENNITVAFPSEYVIPEGSMDIIANGTGINVAGKATVNVQVPVGPDLSNATGSDGAYEVDVLAGKWFYGKNGLKQGTLPLLSDHTFTLSHDGSSNQASYVLVPEDDTYNYFALEVGDSGHVKNGVKVSLENLAWDKSYSIN